MNENEMNNVDVLDFPILAEEITALPSEWDCYPILWEEIEVNTASSPVTTREETLDKPEKIKDVPVQEVSDVKSQPKSLTDSSKAEKKCHFFESSEILTKRQFKRKPNGLIALKFLFGQMEYHNIDVKNNQIIVSRYGRKTTIIDKTDVVDVKGVYNKDASRKLRLEDSYSQIQVNLIDGRVLVIQSLYFDEKKFNEFVDSFREAIE